MYDTTRIYTYSVTKPLSFAIFQELFVHMNIIVSAVEVVPHPQSISISTYKQMCIYVLCSCTLYNFVGYIAPI